MDKTGIWAERRAETRQRTAKGVLTNKHEREFYNFCLTGRYRTVEHNVEVRTSCGFSKISETRATEIAKMANEARIGKEDSNESLFAYCMAR